MDKLKRNKQAMEMKKNDRRFADRGDVRRVVRIPTTVKLDIQTQISEEYLGGGDSLVEEHKAPVGGGRGGGGVPSALQHGAGVGGAGAKTSSGTNESKEHKKEFRTNKRGDKWKPDGWMVSIDRRRELAQKYTFKKQHEEAKTPKPKDTISRDEEMFVVHDDSTPHIDASNGIQQKQQGPETKPVIKTVTQKGASITVYKAVSFEKKKSVPLRVSVPGKLNPASPKSSRSSRKTGSTRSPDRNSKSSKNERTKSVKQDQQKVAYATAMSSPLRTVSPTDSPQLSKRHKTKNHSRRKRTSSPEVTPSLLPLTEMAKWKPDTVNAHTKPYYEAWVNTKLSAISRNNDPQTLMEKRQIIKQFQHAMENAPPLLTPEDMCDEAYAGRIRVYRRQKESR